MSRSTRIAFLGECMIELQQTPEGGINKSYAGDTLNSATYLARLRDIHAADVHYITALGDDEFSSEMIDNWQHEGINCSGVRRLPGKLPGLYYVHVDSAGERSFLYWRGESAAKELLSPSTSPALQSLAGYDYLYLSGISLAILDCDSRNRLLQLLADARAKGSKICFDNNYRPRLWQSISRAQAWYRKVLDLTDIAFLTFDDERALWGDATVDETLARYADTAIAELVIKCGADPCIVRRSGVVHRVAAQPIPARQVIDTNAAGDSFSAGYLCGMLSHTQSPEMNATIGHRVAGTVIQHRGAVIDQNPILDIQNEITILVQASNTK